MRTSSHTINRTSSEPTLAYPLPPSPPDSSTTDQADEDETAFDSKEEFYTARGSFSEFRNVEHKTEPLKRDEGVRPTIDYRYWDVDADEDAQTSTTTTTTATNLTTTTGSSRSSTKRARAKKAAQVMSKPIRKSYIGMVAGLASTAGFGQALFLKATYQSPPDARGPRSGIERPNRGVETLSSAEGHVTRVLARAPSAPSSGAGAAEATQIAVDKAVDAAVDAVKVHLEGLDLSPVIERHSGHLVTRRKRILIIGDSLVSGVGGESSFDDGPSDGPALPRQVARSLSEMLNVDVQWNAISLTGGDVRMLKRKIIPMLRRESARGSIGDISAVVLVTGVNDWKRISPLRTAAKFRSDLAEFINKIREQVGEECSVFLPAIPGVRHTPRFHEPLRSILIFLNDYWDSQKVLLSRSMKKVYFVGQPANEEWGANPRQFFSDLDRVHPSELGYHRWADRIAEHMVSAFKKGMQGAAKTASEAVSNVTQIASAAAADAVVQAADVADAAKKDVSTATAAVAVVASNTQPQSP